MLVFFVSSNLISRIGKVRRRRIESTFEKSSRRDALQVISNGGVAGVITLLWLFTHHESLYIGYLGAVAAATADTWGTEVGVLSSAPPSLITTFERVEPGTSGAVSFLGLSGSVVGCVTIFLSALFWLDQMVGIAAFSILLGGIIGAVIDSALGSTFQLQYKCNVCNKLTERETHCGMKGCFSSGFEWMRNDQVNLICTISGCVASLVLWQLLASEG